MVWRINMKKKMLFFLFTLSVVFSLFGNAAAADDGAKVLSRVSKSTVRIMLDGSSGSGFFINDRHIVTNHHVVSPYLKDSLVGGKGWWTSANNTVVNVVYSNASNDIVKGIVIQDWPEVDLAVVEIESGSAKRIPAKLANEAGITGGMSIYTIGYPAVNDTNLIESGNASVTAGVISKISRDVIGYENGTPYQKLIIDSTINPGNSGGPIADKNGNVIGIANANYIKGNNIAFFGIHIHELTSRLDAAGITYQSGFSKSSLILYIIIGLLTVGVIAAAVMLVKKGKSPSRNISQSTSKSNSAGASGNAFQTSSDNIITKTAPVYSSKTASIQGLTGQFQGIKKSISQEKDVVLGTDPSSCNMVFEKAEKGISRKHCRIHYSKSHQRFVIQDLNSTNGTVLIRGSQQRKVPADSGIALQNGDVIYIPNKSNSFRINL